MNLTKNSLLCISFVFTASISLFSQEKTWVGGGAAGVWEDAGNWSPFGVPALSSDDVLIDGAYSVTVSSTSTIESLFLKGGADLTIAANHALTVENNGGSDGVDLSEAGTSLTVHGTLNSNGHGGNGIDIDEDCSFTVSGSGMISINDVAANGIETSENMVNAGTITITNHAKVGIRIQGNIPNRTVLNSGSITISGGLYGINQKNDNWLFTNNGTVTISNASTSLIRGGTNITNNGTLKGNGLVGNGNYMDLLFNPGSIIAPGTSIGKLTFEETVDFTGVSIDIEINGGTTPGTDYDQIAVIDGPETPGDVTLTGATLNLSGTYMPDGSEEFILFDKVSAGAITGTFSGLPEGATVNFNGSSFFISYIGGDGNDIALSFDSFLPIELLDFSAQAMGNEVKLSWTTATETNNDYFTLERSLDGRTFEEIATIFGNGTTTEISKYIYIDKNPERGLNYYRLKQTDFDGQFSYSDLETVKFGADERIKVYPTMVKDVITVETGADVDGELTVIIRDLTGKDYKSFDINSKSNKIEIPLSYLSPGSYFISIYTSTSVQTQKIIKL